MKARDCDFSICYRVNGTSIHVPPMKLSVDAKLVRTMVGRIEIVTPGQRKLLGQIAAGRRPTPSRCDRLYTLFGTIARTGSTSVIVRTLPERLGADELKRRPTALQSFIDGYNLRGYAPIGTPSAAVSRRPACRVLFDWVPLHCGVESCPSANSASVDGDRIVPNDLWTTKNISGCAFLHATCSNCRWSVYCRSDRRIRRCPPPTTRSTMPIRPAMMGLSSSSSSSSTASWRSGCAIRHSAGRGVEQQWHEPAAAEANRFGCPAADVIDEVHWLAFVSQGKALQIVKWLHEKHIAGGCWSR